MQQPLIESLIGLREHYQGVHEEIERKAAHIREQLTHVNALVVDQLVENQQFVTSLMGLREHYQALHQEYQHSGSHAREQLAHVNALLAEQLLRSTNQQSVSIQASTVNENPALTEAASLGTEEPSAAEDEVDQLAQVDEANEPESATDANFDAQDSALEEEPASPTPAAAVEQSEAEPSPDSSVNGETPKSSFPPLKTAILPKYQRMTKLQAVESLLQENSGTVLHIDYITRALHGELEADALRAEKSRMSQTLREGALKGLWDKAPGAPGCYTINRKLLEPKTDSKEITQQSKVSFRRKPQSNSKSSHTMLPRYQHLNLTDAVEVVVRENAGQILNTDFVARALYGDLEGRDLTKAKDRIGKTLWSGAKQKRWQRVPGKMGAYTLDLKL